MEKKKKEKIGNHEVLGKEKKIRKFQSTLKCNS